MAAFRSRSSSTLLVLISLFQDFLLPVGVHTFLTADQMSLPFPIYSSVVLSLLEFIRKRSISTAATFPSSSSTIVHNSLRE